MVGRAQRWATIVWPPPDPPVPFSLTSQGSFALSHYLSVSQYCMQGRLLLSYCILVLHAGRFLTILLYLSIVSPCVSTGHTAISQRGTYSRRCVFVDLKTKKSALSSGPDGLCSIREFPAGAGALWGRKELLKGRASKTEEPRVKSRLCSSKAELLRRKSHR
jgi:hypothetical protein